MYHRSGSKRVYDVLNKFSKYNAYEIDDVHNIPKVNITNKILSDDSKFINRFYKETKEQFSIFVNNN